MRTYSKWTDGRGGLLSMVLLLLGAGISLVSACSGCGVPTHNDGSVVENEPIMIDLRTSGPRDISAVPVGEYVIRFDAYVAGVLGRKWTPAAESVLTASLRARRLGGEFIETKVFVEPVADREDMVSARLVVYLDEPGTYVVEFRELGRIVEAFAAAEFNIARPETLPTSVVIGTAPIFLLTTGACPHARAVTYDADDTGVVTSWILELSEELSSAGWQSIELALNSADYAVVSSGDRTSRGTTKLSVSLPKSDHLLLRPANALTEGSLVAFRVPKEGGVAGTFATTFGCEAADLTLELATTVSGDKRTYAMSPVFAARSAAFDPPKAGTP